MAGNSKPRGAVRGSKKGPTTGSGGNNKRRLEGKGPTPKAEDRPYHAAAKRKKAAEKKGAKRGGTTSPRAGASPRGRSEKPKGEIVSGRNAVLEALRENVPATELIVARSIDVDDRVAESLKLALHHGLNIREVHRAEIENINANSQGIILAIKPYQYSSFQEIAEQANHPMMIIALDGVTDPRNLGAIVRSAAAFGAAGVVMTERRAAAMTAAAWKTSAGAAARLRVAQVTNLARTIEDAQKLGCFVVGLDGESDVTLSEMKVAKENLMIVVGSEEIGRASCRERVSSPV